MTTNNLYEQLLLQQIEKNPQNLMMFPSIFWSKHHDSFNHKFFDHNFDTVNPRYFGSEEFKRNILATPLLKVKSPANLSKSEKWDLLKKEPLALLQFDLSECSNVMIDYALDQCPHLLTIMDQSIQTEERVRKALTKNGLVLISVADQFLTYKNCKLAIAQNIHAIHFVPADLIDDFFINKICESNEWVLDLIPRSVATNPKLEDHFYALDQLKAFDSYTEIYSFNGDSDLVYSCFKAVVKNNLKGLVFQNLSPACYISQGFNYALIQFMQDFGPEIIHYFDIDQLNEIHIQNAILFNETFESLPTSVWQYIFPKLIETKTEQLFHFPESLKGLLSGVWKEVLEYCIKVNKEKPELTVPNFLFNEIAYKDAVDENIIRFSTIRKVCDILVNNKAENIEALNEINGTNSTFYEIKLLEDKIDTTKIGRLFEQDPIWYPLLLTKTVENSVRFAQKYPTAHYEISEEMLKDEEFVKAINATNPEFLDI